MSAPIPPVPDLYAKRSWGLVLGLLAIVLAWFWLQWPTLASFVTAIDHHPQFMQDFAGHYYPMGRLLLATAAPVPGYFYTAFFALLLVPAGALPPATALVAWLAVQAIALSALVLVVRRALALSGPATLLFALLCATAYPILSNLKWGQVSVLLVVLIIGATFAADRGRPYLGGALLGMATAIKFYPALFVLVFLAQGNRRAVSAFAITAGVCYVVIPALVLGPARWLAFEQAVHASLAGADWVAFDLNSQFAAHVVGRWVWLATRQEASPVLLLIVKLGGYGIALACLAWSWTMARRDGMLAIVPLFLALPFLLKTSWPHYFSSLPFCQALLLTWLWPVARRGDRAGHAGLALVAASVLLGSLLTFDLLPGWTAYNGYGLPFLANLLLVGAAGVARFHLARPAHGDAT